MAKKATDLLSLFGGIGSGLYSPPLSIARTKVGGLIVSTVDTNDLGPETALLDEKGAHPVERYLSLREAKQGHKRWVEFARDRTNTEVKKLGYGSLTNDELIILNRKGEE